MKLHVSPLSAVLGASFVAAVVAHNGPFRAVAVLAFVASGIAITATIRRGGTR